MYLLPTVSIFYVQVGLCHIFRDYDGRWQISEVRRTRHEYYGTKSSFVLPWISQMKSSSLLSYQTMKYKFNYTSLVKFLNLMESKKFVQMQFGPFFMKIVENRGIKNSEAMEFVLLKWSIFWSIIWGKPSINGIEMGKWARLTNIKYLIAFWNDLQPHE